jgi:exodeoxyribonuclease VII large subunit
MSRAHPRRRLDEQTQRLDELQNTLKRCAERGVRHQHVTWHNLATRLMRVRPRQLVKQRRELLRIATRQLREDSRHVLKNLRNRFATVEARLRLLGPEQVLSRGYSITMDAVTGEILHDAKQVKSGQRLRTRLKSGEITSRAGE